MGQYWELVNIDKWAILYRYGFGLKLPEFVTDRSAEQLVGMLQMYKRIPVRASQERLFKSKSSTSSILVALPQEIIDLITENLTESSSDDETIQGATNLALSCTYFFRLMAPRLQKLMPSDQWAGDRLIFVGDYADGYPLNIASEEEQERWAKTPDGGNRNPLYVHTKKYEDEVGEVGKVEAEQDMDPQSAICPLALINEDDKRRCEMLVKLLDRQPTRGDPVLDQPVLRNITAKAYVKDQTLAEKMPWADLGDVITVQTLWTHDPSGTCGLENGEWAGHRFDIATLADVGNDWMDASEAVLERIQVFEGFWETRELPKRGRRAASEN